MHTKGFTLIEAILYIGLFGLIFTGILVSMYPLFTNTEKLTRRVVTENEITFITSKIRYALAHGITSSSIQVIEPSEGTQGDSLTIADGIEEYFHFEVDASNAYCTPPRVCSVLTYRENGGDLLPLNTERVAISSFTVVHHTPQGNTPRLLEISFIANGTPVGPLKQYLHF